MKRWAPSSFLFAAALPLLLAVPQAVLAQDAVQADQGKIGERLFNQSCGVCHLKQQINTTSYAPALSQTSLGGKSEVMHEVIMNGTPRMPGFKTQFAPGQIDAIVAYIKTVPAPQPAGEPSKARGPGEPD